MSIPLDATTDFLWRGCTSNFPQPLTEDNEHDAVSLADTVFNINCLVSANPLDDIVYRSGSGEDDIRHHVFFWGRNESYPVDQVFLNGFRAMPQGDTPDEVYFNLDRYVHNGGRPLYPRPTDDPPPPSVFFSTTLSSHWTPRLNPGENFLAYRYEIFAPGGIWVTQTLGGRYRYPGQDEVSFVGGIAPQYILSAQLFNLTGTIRGTTRQRVGEDIWANGYFTPQSHPIRLLKIQRPIQYYVDESGRWLKLKRHYFVDESDVCEHHRTKREVSNTDSDTMDWYNGDVANYESYINAAFRSWYSENEAYIFMKDEYLLLNYAPGTTDDKVENGPLFICDGFPSLSGTAFAEYGIDCAFGSHDKNEAFIFSGNLCAQIHFTPGTTDDYIIKGPMTIKAMFPFFKGTVFESSIDAAFEATTKYEAYLFKGNHYALINYGSSSHSIAIGIINQGFPSMKNTIFESGIDAAFASHRTDEAYLFKGDSYALINFAPGTTNVKIIGGGVKKILPNWPSLRSILPRKNRGLDCHGHTETDARCYDHDEL